MNTQEAKLKNIVDMSLTFTAMMRVFEEGSKEYIRDKICEIIVNMLTKEAAYAHIHEDFCEWVFQNIPTSRNGKTSYGQAAKVIDVSMKVVLYYCNLPDKDIAKLMIPKLHCAIDTPILMHLKSGNSQIAAKFLSQIDKNTYCLLQKAVKDDIEKNYSGILPVEYDDIMWRKLNKDD